MFPRRNGQLNSHQTERYSDFPSFLVILTSCSPTNSGLTFLTSRVCDSVQ